MWKDPIVEAVHKIRFAIEAEGEYDFEKIFEHTKNFKISLPTNSSLP